MKSITKFNYLRTFLRGAALALISGLSLTSENYNQAIELLEKRYTNKQLLITLHTNHLLPIAPITSTNDIEEIRETYGKIKRNVENLCSLDIDTSQCSPVLISILKSKLSEDINLQISWSMSISREWDDNELLAAKKDNKHRGSRKPDNFTVSQ